MRYEASLFTSQLLAFRLVNVPTDATRRIRPRRPRCCSRSSATTKSDRSTENSTLIGITISPDFTSPDRFDHVLADLVRFVNRLELRHVRVASAFVGMELQYKAISCVLDVFEA